MTPTYKQSIEGESLVASRKQAKNYTKECYLLARRRWRNSSRILQGEENEVTKYENDEVVSIALPASWTRFDFWLKKKKKADRN